MKDIYTRSLSLSDPRTAKQSRFGIHNENKQAEQCDLYKKIMNYIIASSLYIPRSQLNWFTEALPYIFWSISCKHKVKAIAWYMTTHCQIHVDAASFSYHIKNVMIILDNCPLYLSAQSRITPAGKVKKMFHIE